MDFIIREIRETEYPLLEEFLYEAIFVPGIEIIDANEEEYIMINRF